MCAGTLLYVTVSDESTVASIKALIKKKKATTAGRDHEGKLPLRLWIPLVKELPDRICRQIYFLN